MSKKLAFKGHETRGKEIIELLEMMGGINKNMLSAHIGDVLNPHVYFIEPDFSDNRIVWDYLLGLEWDGRASEMMIFTLEEFLEKYPFKVGDKVYIKVDPNENCLGSEKLYGVIESAKWIEKFGYVVYKLKYYDGIVYREELYPYKEDVSMEDNKLFGTLSNPVETKSYAVGLKDGKVIECGVNKEIVMNEIKPLFKHGDVIKLKGCPDKNLFWIVVDVVEDGYIFNDGEKCPFDDQHHYEKTNREVINTQPDITAKVVNKNHKMGPKSKLPSKYYEETQSKREYDELRMPLDDDENNFPLFEPMFKVNDELEYKIPDGYEITEVSKDTVFIKPIKSKYPTTYAECCDVLNIPNDERYIDIDVPLDYNKLVSTFTELLICCKAYWKIAGEEMGLGKPWEPDWTNLDQLKCCIWVDVGEFITMINVRGQHILAFPTEEMRDVFHENFKKEIEQCKELL